MNGVVSTTSTLRRWILAVLVFGIVGTGVELLLLRHYEEPTQLVPLALIAIALGVLLWHVVGGCGNSVRALQVTMLLFVIGGATGVTLHFSGAAEFQLEGNPTLGTWDLTKKVMRAEAPPVLAPGVMMQLGLLGLVYTYRHPRDTPPGHDEE